MSIDGQLAEMRSVALQHVCYLPEDTANPLLIRPLLFKGRYFNLRVSVNAGFE